MSKLMRIKRRDVLKTGLLGGAGLAIGGSFPVHAQGASRKINIVNTSGGTNLVLAAIMKQQGIFEQFGLDATITNVSDGAKLMGGILTGEMDICPLSGFGQVFPAIEKGAKMKVLAGGAILPMQAILTTKPDIKTLKDLEGRTVGTGSLGALIHQMCVAALRKAGIDDTKVNFVNIGSATDIFRAVAAGTVDAGSSEIWQIGKNNTRALDGGRFWVDIPDYTYQAGFASDGVIQNKRETLVRALAAYAKLYRFIQDGDSKEAFLKGFAAGMGKPDDEAALEQWTFYQKVKPFASSLVLSQQKIDYMQNLNVSFKIQSKVLPFEQVADMSVANDAIKMLG
jgi:ABC-type nitrate/sulfonate/bicarbonate transport system substrate-binding protein